MFHILHIYCWIVFNIFFPQNKPSFFASLWNVYIFESFTSTWLVNYPCERLRGKQLLPSGPLTGTLAADAFSCPFLKRLEAHWVFVSVPFPSQVGGGADGFRLLISGLQGPPLISGQDTEMTCCYFIWLLLYLHGSIAFVLCLEISYHET